MSSQSQEPEASTAEILLWLALVATIIGIAVS